MERRTVVKGAAWSMPAILIASAAPSVAASVSPVAIGNACKLPAHNTTAYYRLSLDGLTGVANITSVKVDGKSVGYTPSFVDGLNNTIVVGECDNANTPIVFEVATTRGVFTKTVKALPCKD